MKGGNKTLQQFMQFLRRLPEFGLLSIISSQRVERQKKKFGKGSFFEKPQVIVVAALFSDIPSLSFCSGTSPVS